jgi:hypothetical protein
MAAVPRRLSFLFFFSLGAFLGYPHMPLRHTGLEHILHLVHIKLSTWIGMDWILREIDGRGRALLLVC